MADQKRMPLVEALEAFGRREPTYFAIPGHRFERGVSPELRKRWGDGVFRYDLTEADGLDDLHHPEGAILEAQKLAAKLYGADRTWFLVNGTTCGNEAMILSAVKPGEKIIVPRNAHKSALMGLVLSGAVPVWVMPEYLEEWGMYGAVAPEAVEKAFLREPDCRAALVTSPTYYGICSDLRAIAEICHRRGAQLLVDEAHGSHFCFSERYPEGALRQGADVCAQSTHKTSGGMTQSSMLHCRGTLANPAAIDAALKLVMSTSPSYVLMASLDAARCQLAASGRKMMERAADLAAEARRLLEEIPGVEVLRGEELPGRAAAAADPARLVFSARRLGITGYELQERLFRESGVATEMADWENVVAVVTWANEEKEIRRLAGGVRRAVETAPGRAEREMEEKAAENLRLRTVPEMAVTPREAWFAEGKAVPWEKALGCVAAETAAPYPPGIPLVCPGEVLTEEVWDALDWCRRGGVSIHGPADPELQSFRVIEDV